jgi:hypothetical protein
MNNVFNEYELYLNAVAKANEDNKPVIFDALAAAGLTRVTVEFDGAGDSGQIDGITAYAGEALAEVPLTSVTLQQATRSGDDFRTFEMTLPDAIEALCYGYLEQCHDGWENNDGASGTFEFDVLNRSIHLDFHERFMDVNTSCHDF